MDSIQAFLLGIPHVLLDGKPVVFPFKQVEALLYYLLTEGPTSRTRLADLIWGDRGDEQRVRSNMRNASYLLRKIFGHDFLIEPQKNVISVNPAYPIDLDLSKLTSAQDYALDDYPGDFLEDFYLKDNEYFNEWLLNTRQHMNRLALERLKLEAKQRFEAQDWPICERMYRKLLSLDEFDESVYCRLMEMYRACGEYAKALALYGQMKKLFSEELFQPPGAEANALVKSIKTLRNQTIAASIAERTEVPEARTPFYGRQEEMFRLRQTIQTFLRGDHTASLVVTGETGIGKTSLVEHVLSGFSGLSGAAVIFSSRCYRAEEAYALKPWQSIFEQVIAYAQQRGMEQLAEPFTAAASIVFPFLAKENRSRWEPDEIAATRCQNPERAIAHGLLQLAQAQRMILFFDDLQWADALSATLMRDILTSGNNRNILLLATCKIERHQHIDSLIEDMLLSRLMEALELKRFDYQDTIRLALLLLPEPLPSEEAGRRFFRETEGNPFFIVETANSIRHNGSMTDITPSMRNSIYSRIMLLPPQYRNILDLLCIFFDGASFELLHKLSNMEEYELIELLEALIAKQLLKETTLPDGILFQFKHQKFLEYVYGELSLTKRRMLHNKTALYLESTLNHNESDLPIYSRLLYHFNRSGNQKKYLEYYVEYVYSYLNRSHEYYPILTGCPSGPYADTPDIASADQAAVSTILQDIQELVNRCSGQYSREDELGFLSDYCHMMGRYHIRKTEHEEGLRYIRQLAAYNQEGTSPQCAANRIKANRQLACVYLNRCDMPLMRTVINSSLGILQDLNQPEETAIWLRLSGLCCIMSGQLEEGTACLRRAIDGFEHSPELEKYWYNLAASYAWLGEAERHRFRYQQAQAYYQRAITICQEHALAGGIASFYTYAGQAAMDSGNWEQAEHFLTLAVHSFQAVDLMWGRGTAFSYYALLCLHRKEDARAQSCLRYAADCAVRLESKYEQGLLSRIYGQLALEMEHNPRLRAVFQDDLDQSACVYCRRARKLLRDVYSPIDQYYLDRLELS